jgi:hypothetical protein
MPVRIEFEYISVGEANFFDSQYASEATPSQKIPSAFHLPEILDCATPRVQPKSFVYEFGSPATSRTASDHSNADRDWSDEQIPFKEYKETPDSEGNDRSCFVPFLDPFDWEDVVDGDRRFFVASQLVELLSKHDGQVLLSKVGSQLTDEARAALREMRIRLLTFLKEKPQKKYFRIDGAGGGQVLLLRDLRDPSAGDELQSLNAVRAELFEILAPSCRKNSLLLRSLGSSLSHAAKVTLKVNRLSLSQFLALDNSFVLRKSHVYLAEGVATPPF